MNVGDRVTPNAKAGDHRTDPNRGKAGYVVLIPELPEGRTGQIVVVDFDGKWWGYLAEELDSVA